MEVWMQKIYESLGSLWKVFYTGFYALFIGHLAYTSCVDQHGSTGNETCPGISQMMQSPPTLCDKMFGGDGQILECLMLSQYK